MKGVGILATIVAMALAQEKPAFIDYATRQADDRPEAITAVQQQLGLKLEPVKASIEIFIVDRVHKPTDN